MRPLAKATAAGVALLAVRGALWPVAELLRLRRLRRESPELMDPQAALASILAALAEDG